LEGIFILKAMLQRCVAMLMVHHDGLIITLDLDLNLLQMFNVVHRFSDCFLTCLITIDAAD